MPSRADALKSLLSLFEKEGIQSGEKALTRGMADKAAIEGSLAASAADKAALSEAEKAVLPSKYDQMSYDLKGIDDTGFSNNPKLIGPDGNPVKSELPNFEMVGAPRTEIPAGSQSELMSKFPDKAPPVSSPNFKMVGGPKSSPHPDSQAYSLGSNPDVQMLPPEMPSQYSGPMNYDIKTMTPEQKLSLQRGEKGAKLNYSSLAAGAGGALGLGAMGLMGSDNTQNKMTSEPPMGTGGLTNLPGFPSKSDKFDPKDLLVDNKDREPANEENNEEDNTAEEAPKQASNSAPSKSVAQKEEPPKKSDTQALADMLQAQNPEDEETFAEAQKRKNLAILANQLGSAGDIIGGALARTGPNEAAQKAFQNNVALAGQATKDWQERKAAEEQDPNSAVSKNYRDFLKRYGVDAGPGVTAAQIKQTLLPAAEKEQLKKAQLEAQKFTAEQNRLSREAIAREGNENRKSVAEENRKGREAVANASSERQATNLAKRQLEMAKNRALAGGGMAANRVRNRINAADNIFGTVGVSTDTTEADIDKMDDKKLDLTKVPMVAELAVEMNSMLSPAGVPPQSTFKKLLPNNLAMDKAKVVGYVTNSLPPAKQAEFIKLTLKTAARIKRNSQAQNAKLMGQYFSGTGHIREHLPDDYNEAVKSLGLNPDDLMASGAPKTKDSPGFVPMTKDGVEYKPIPADRVEEAKAHGYRE